MEVVLLVVGLVFAGIGSFVVWSARADEANGRRVPGEVIGYAERFDSKDKSRTYAILVAFRHPLEGRYIVEHPIASNALPYAIGEKVKLLLTRGGPLRGRIDGPGMFWFGGGFIAIGAICTVIFFLIFQWNLFSLLIGGAVLASIGWQFWQKREVLQGGGVLAKMREATMAEAIHEEAFDHSRVLPQAQLEALLRKQPRHAIVAGIIFLLLGTAGITASWFWTQHRFAFLDRAAVADGVIVDSRMRRSSDSTTWSAVVEFTPEGAWTTTRFTSSSASSHPSWSIGDEVRVLYDPANPQDALMDSGIWNRVIPFIPGIVGALLVLLGISSIRNGLRKTPKLQPTMAG